MTGQARQQTLPLFSTPVLVFEWEDTGLLNETLARVILEKEQNDAGVAHSNVGGWHSDHDFFSWEHKAVADIRQRLEGIMPQVLDLSLKENARKENYKLHIAAWALVVRQGDYHAVHAHTPAHWSGVYYVDAGDPDENNPLSGRLELFDPRMNVDMMGLSGSAFSTPCVMEPVSGRAVLFPSWLKHMVHPYTGKRPRVAISFNASFAHAD